jgi:predicted MFS family arabinose efflux permease
MLPSVARPASVRLQERLAPVRDVRIALTLLTSLFAFGGFLMVYTYAGVVLERVTHGHESVLAGLFLLWGVAATAGNLLSGRLVDRFESRTLINAMLWIAVINFCALPWTSAHAFGAAIALVIWGVCGWGLLVPQQHRLVQISPHIAPLVLALNNTATYVGLACSGLLGGALIPRIGGQYLSLIAAVLIAMAFVFAEAAHRYMRRPIIRHRESVNMRTTIE